MTTNKKLADIFAENKADSREPVEMSLLEYFELCKGEEGRDHYESAAGRLLKAIGEPKIVDTSKDPKLSRIYDNKKIMMYEAFSDFYGKGAREAVEQVIRFLKSAARGEEADKQILYLVGPVGSAKSSIAERLKELMQEQPFYALKAGDEISPLYENPLGVVNADPIMGKKLKKVLTGDYEINPRFLKRLPSPWAMAKLGEFGGDVTKFSVVKVYPSIAKQIAISKTEPGDQSTQDVTALVGKLNIRLADELDQNDPRAYSYSGGLCIGSRGIAEIVEMNKAERSLLHPLLTATQERNFNGTEAIGAIPFDGLIIAHSNETEWNAFRNDKKNEAIVSRTCTVRVPYTLEWSEEVKIYQKMIAESGLAKAPCAPGTVEMMAQWAVMTRLEDKPEGTDLYAKMKVYDGENLKDTNPQAKSSHEYRTLASVGEGTGGMDTRFSFKTLSETFNYSADQTGELAANPVHLVTVLKNRIRQQEFPKDTEAKYMNILNQHLIPNYMRFVEKEINTAFLESYGDYGQNIFDRYVQQAESWLDDLDYVSPDTGTIMNRRALETALEEIEKPAGIANSRDFRGEVVRFVLGARAKNNGENPKWDSYAKLKGVIEKKMFSNMEQLLPVISFGKKANAADQERHDNYVQGMKKRGYTEQQVRIVTDLSMGNLKML